ncbi:hypothetical protein L3Q82_010905, partial [Scortum barcoo]
VLRVVLLLSLATLLHAVRRDQAVSVDLEQDFRLKGKALRLVLDSSVQPQITSMSSPSIANMSLSPWSYRETCVNSRLPMRISHTQCLTSGCLSLQGGGEDAALEAKPIYYQVLVLHRVKRQRKNKKGRKRVRYEFRLATEVITVGCTCVRPSVVPQQ